MNMDYKEGDKVLIKTWNEMVDEFGVDENWDIDIPDNYGLTYEDFKYLENRIVVISCIDMDGDFWINSVEYCIPKELIKSIVSKISDYDREEEMNKIESWQQGYFVDQRKYNRWTKEEKERANYAESHNVRAYPTKNAICFCNDPEDAKWIASRLNFATKIEKRLGDICKNFVG